MPNISATYPAGALSQEAQEAVAAFGGSIDFDGCDTGGAHFLKALRGSSSGDERKHSILAWPVPEKHRDGCRGRLPPLAGRRCTLERAGLSKRGMGEDENCTQQGA